MRYLVRFRNGSSDYLDAESAREARDLAERDFGGKVVRVEVIQDCNDEDEESDQDEDEDDEDEDEDDDKDEDEEEEDD